jgi:uroporphyrinogen-III decarboxylase
MIACPVACVAGVMKYEMFLELVVTEPALVRELTEICRCRILDILKVLLSVRGIEYVRMSGAEMLTPPMGSEAIYDELVHEPSRSLVAFIHERAGVPVHVHSHGRMSHALTRLVEAGVDYTEPVEAPPDGDVTMAEARRLVGERMALGGNVQCRVLCNESEEAAERATRAAFEGGKRRFVLRPTEGPSPELAEKEFRNYMRMIDVWEEMSPLG